VKGQPIKRCWPHEEKQKGETSPLRNEPIQKKKKKKSNHTAHSNAKEKQEKSSILPAI